MSYDRELAVSEIAAIFRAGPRGRCFASRKIERVRRLLAEAEGSGGAAVAIALIEEGFSFRRESPPGAPW
jgi:hypothetical protein